MVSRIRALRSSFNLMLSIAELFIAVKFILYLFGSSKSWLLKDVSDFADWIESSGSVITSGTNIRGPAIVLVLVLGFMLFSFVLFTILPKMVERKEKEIEFEEIDLK